MKLASIHCYSLCGADKRAETAADARVLVLEEHKVLVRFDAALWEKCDAAALVLKNN